MNYGEIGDTEVNLLKNTFGQNFFVDNLRTPSREGWNIRLPIEVNINYPNVLTGLFIRLETILDEYLSKRKRKRNDKLDSDLNKLKYTIHRLSTVIDGTVNVENWRERHIVIMVINFFRSLGVPINVENDEPLEELPGYHAGVEPPNQRNTMIPTLEGRGEIATLTTTERRRTGPDYNLFDSDVRDADMDVRPRREVMIPAPAPPLNNNRNTNNSSSNDKVEDIIVKNSPGGDKECPICLLNVEGECYYTTKCYNYYHKQCIKNWCKQKNQCLCPTCKRTFIFPRIGGKTNKKKGKSKKTRKSRKSKKTRKSRR